MWLSAGADGPEIDEDLGTLLEDLAAPMRAAEEAPAPAPEPRRVGGPLLMRPSDRLHLRIIVDHSCIEVYTGTGEVLSTRIYRGRGPDPEDSGLEFVAFGGAAILERVSAYEVGSAWAERGAAAGPKAAKATTTSRGSSAAATPKAGGANTQKVSPVAAAPTSRERANDLFDEILSDLGPMPGGPSPVAAMQV